MSDVANLFGDISDFHGKFGLEPPDPDTHHLPEEMQKFRLRFMLEELEEYEDAVERGEMAEALDALVDLTYVALGTAYLHGFHKFNEAWRRVHSANMTKVRAERKEDSKRESTYDVVKPPGWRPPDLSDLV